MNRYELRVADLTRFLPLFEVSPHLDIAGFIMFSDVELTVACARALLAKVSAAIPGGFDLIMTAESKGIPLAYELARISGKNYIVARKGVKVYMRDPVNVSVTSMTTAGEQHLFLGSDDIERMRGKKILLVDDVINTGASIKALKELVALAGALVCGKAAVLAEGDAAGRPDIVYLEKLPVFPK
jgi:adenine phosphoribosyltransferase